MIRVLQGQSKPKSVVISSNNRANGGVNCCNKAMEMIKAGKDTLDAVIAGVNIVELDPNDTSVGYGGLPNEDGVVQLDASCVHGPSRRMGAVGAIEGIKTPSKVAQLGMSRGGSAHRQVAAGVSHVEAGDARQEWAHILGIEHRCPTGDVRQGKRQRR
jgi:N4-(beta-N-acetylglucosaminyl)-L-asparaginase